MSKKDGFAKNKVLFITGVMLVSVIGIVVFFLINKDTIFTNLKETDFFGKIFGKTPAIIAKHEVPGGTNEELPLREEFVTHDDIVIFEDDYMFTNDIYDEDSDEFFERTGFVGDIGTPVLPGLKSDSDFSDNIASNIGSNERLNEESLERSFPSSDVNQASMNEPTREPNASLDFASNINPEDDYNYFENKENSDNLVSNKNILAKQTAPNTLVEKEVAPMIMSVPSSSLDLCFVIIDASGNVIRKMVKRSVPKSDSPLTTAINLLIEGPDVRNKEEASCRSLIPEGSKLLGARIADGVAYLNFNEEFEFNPYGIEGSIHQLEQIVFTATEFSTVKSVQFLIEGKKREYLGSEGQWIGTPLSRANF